jgi:FkbM family methyltransferase
MAARIRGLAPAAALERAGAVAGLVASASGRQALRRWRPRSIAAWRLIQGVAQRGAVPATVLDVGANAGQFARAAVEVFGCPVVSFEPLPAAADAFEENLADRPEVVLHRVAVGAEAGTIAFYPHRYSLASSALPRDPTAEDEAWTGESEPIEVPVARLDDLVVAEELRGPILVKLDVQGYEAEVVAGARATLRSADALVVELALVAAYRHQPLADELIALLAGEGWRLDGVLDVRRGPAGAIVEMDALFRPADR